MNKRWHLPFWAGLARAREGIAAVEFALIAPVMILLFMGTFEITGILMADLKLTAAAETVADLVSQVTYNPTLQAAVLQSTDFSNYTSAAQDTLTPLPATHTTTTLLKVAYASVTFTTNTAVVDWHVEANGATPITLATIPNNASNAAVNQLVTNNATDSIIVVNAQYTYISPTTYFLKLGSYTLSEWAFNRPRYVNCVAVTTSPATANIAMTSLNTTGSCP
jgi:Flp pilus assembly protein TadG